MNLVVQIALGLLVGAPIGAAVGVLGGFVWVKIFKATNFEGYSGMLVFFTFMPLGAIVGGVLGVVAALSTAH